MKLGPLQPATLTHRNHFEFGYNGVPFSERNSADDEWFVRYGACERMPHSFYEECLKTARLIRESTTLPIDVLFSGGVDSEVALRAFLDAGIEVRVLSLRFARGLNAHDIEWVERVCSGLGVKARYVDLDLERFWETDAYDYAARTQCVSPQLVSTMWLADQTDGYCVLGSGENFIVKRLEESYIPGESPYLRSIWDLFEKEKIASWYRHFLLQNRDAAPGFFQFTPEIMMSWFLDEMGCDLWNDRIEGKRNSVSSKLPIYQRHFALEERPKYTGFEQVQDLDYKYRLQYRKFYENSDYIVKSPVPTLVAQMMGPVFKKNDLDLRRYISEFENDDWKTSLKLNELPPVELIDGRMYYEFASTNP